MIARRYLACLLFSLSVAAAQTASGPDADWPAYNGGVNGDHYSPLTQIDRANVAQLQVAWTYDTGEKGNLETNPLVIGRTLYGFTVSGKVFALDAATGKRLWLFDPTVDTHDPSIGGATQPSRGFSYWANGKDARLFVGSMNYLYALDPATGALLPTFGDQGRIDLRKGLRDSEGYQKQSVALTSPGLIYKDLIIVGGRNPETHPAPPGDIRAFDVHTGALRWTFHTIPRPGEFGYDTWPPDAWKSAGAANNWTGMTLDAHRGIVYVPTGSAVFDFYGGDRLGNDLFADTLLALDAATGKRLWHFQGVHHDIWDRDFPSPPALVTVTRDGKSIDAVAQTTKQGVVYLFDRVTGEPLFPIEEKPFPPSDLIGEKASLTQPWPTDPAPFARQRLTEDDLTNRTPAAHAWAVEQLRSYHSDGQFVPLTSGKRTIIFPGFDGGAEWGGPAVDPKTGVLYVNANEMAWTGELGLTAPHASGGAAFYASQCSICHGATRTGSPPAFPSLIGVTTRLTDDQIKEIVAHGRGRMVGFPSLDPAKVAELIEYLRTPAAPTTDNAAAPPPASSAQVEYHFTGYNKFLDPDGYPAVAPPWGTLNAIDLKTGKFLWKVPLGEYPALAAKGMSGTGSENYGGPILTASGILFIGATVYDHKFRAFDASTGKMLWETTLPFAGIATPATYSVDGKQYVVIAASGGRDPNSPVGGSYIAFALP
ncbi:MAG TPA: PQQ-binding-like beta-propeller repeat protein [Acidobacteriaceae bacterium]|jgi:quinoprotein glucose dehydrogenase|nr:PQQ-binding-like beta-propeller repeat protein [Acidobacteriaceae bacterium]